MIGISQSGETADTLAAMRLARERGATVLAITNTRGSQATREADGVLYTRAGLEIGVAATKTFVCQVAVMYLLALRLAELRGTLAPARIAELVAELKHLPHCIDELIEGGEARVEAIAETLLGRRVLLLHRPPRGAAGGARGRAEAEGDLLHLHRRLRRRRDEARPDRAARRGDAGRLRGDALAGAREARLEHPGGARARRARDRRQHGRRRRRRRRTPTRRSRFPATDWMLQPILAVIPLQLLAYAIARKRGLNVDQPRNLAKTVTVE